MFCQNCGAELRLEEGFCAVCGASVPRPALHQESAERGGMSPRLSSPRQSAPTASQQPFTGSSLLNGPASVPAAQADAQHVHSYQAIRQASGQRGNRRSLPPVASLAVPAAPATLPEQVMPPLEQAPEASPAPDATLASLAPAAAPVAAPALPAQSNGSAPASQDSSQLALNGYHPVSLAAPSGPAANGHAPGVPVNSHAPQGASAAPFGGSSTPLRASSVAASSLHLPDDIPNRLALSGLAGMLLSFFLPWVIISGSRVTPLSVGWPVFVPLALLLGIALTILMPERALYTRFALALPFAAGCFGLGSAGVVFLVSSAIAANSVGVAFLGVDIGFILFTLAACLLACAGYFKLLRELPLLYAGQIVLAPLPGVLGRGAGSSTQHAAVPGGSANTPSMES